MPALPRRAGVCVRKPNITKSIDTVARPARWSTREAIECPNYFVELGCLDAVCPRSAGKPAGEGM